MMMGKKQYAVAFAFTIVLLVAQATAQSSPTVVYQNTSVWNSGFQAAVSITNTYRLPDQQLDSRVRNAKRNSFDLERPDRLALGNNYIIAGDSWDANIAGYGNVSFGFIGSGSGTGGSPTGCLVSGTSVISTTCPTGPTDHTPPTVPTNLHSPSQTDNSVLLAWNASVDNSGGSGVAGYDVFTNATYSGSTVSTSLNVTGLAPSTRYRFQVRARDNAGNVSAESNPIYVTTGNAPPPCDTLPGLPGNFTASNVTAYSVTLSWTAANPGANCTITGYQIQENGTQVALVSGSTLTTVIGNLAPDTNYRFTMTATNQYGTSSPAGPIYVTTSNGPPPNTWPASVFAPYADMLLYPTFSLSQTEQAIGVKYFTMALVVDGGGCSASWGGVIPLSQGFELADVANLRAEGGDVIISFGGAAGQELAQVCTTVPALEAQYQAVINKYNLTRIDFDIEGAAMEDMPSITRRNQRIGRSASCGLASGQAAHRAVHAPGDALGPDPGRHQPAAERRQQRSASELRQRDGDGLRRVSECVHHGAKRHRRRELYRDATAGDLSRSDQGAALRHDGRDSDDRSQ